MKHHFLHLCAGMFCAALFIGTPGITHAATAKIAGTPVDAINSIRLVDSFVSPSGAFGNLRGAVFGITFSIHAFAEAITIPLRTGIIDPSALVQYAPQITFVTESRYGATSEKRLYASTVIAEGATSSTMVIAPGTEGTATLLVAYADVPDADRVDRLHITSLPLYFGTSTQPLLLNPSEVSDLKTEYSSLTQ